MLTIDFFIVKVNDADAESKINHLITEQFELKRTKVKSKQLI